MAGPQPVTPYIWTYQPETGTAAGAQQDYGAVINWLSADPGLCERIRRVNEARNATVRADFALRQTPLARGGVFNEWYQVTPPPPGGPPFFPLRRRRARAALDAVESAEGEQLAGAGYQLGDGRRYRKLTRDALPFPYNWQVYEKGRWRPLAATMDGRGANATSAYPTVLRARRRNALESYMAPAGRQLQTARIPRSRYADEHMEQGPSVDVRSGLTPLAFARAFPPVVYGHPFSDRSGDTFPVEFSPLYDPHMSHPAQY